MDDDCDADDDDDDDDDDDVFFFFNFSFVSMHYITRLMIKLRSRQRGFLSRDGQHCIAGMPWQRLNCGELSGNESSQCGFNQAKPLPNIDFFALHSAGRRPKPARMPEHRRSNERPRGGGDISDGEVAQEPRPEHKVINGR